jgi:hypothetical protein
VYGFREDITFISDIYSPAICFSYISLRYICENMHKSRSFISMARSIPSHLYNMVGLFIPLLVDNLFPLFDNIKDK